MKIEVVYALPDRQELIELSVDAGTSVETAIGLSGIAERFPELDLTACAVGVWGRVVAPATILRDGDRVEIYRPLEIDPREARRRLARQGKTMGATEPSTED